MKPLPCPFCGSKKIVIWVHDHGGIGCEGCKVMYLIIQVDMKKKKELRIALIKRWNRRA